VKRGGKKCPFLDGSLRKDDGDDEIPETSSI
jgi:hypothetical protein